MSKNIKTTLSEYILEQKQQQSLTRLKFSSTDALKKAISILYNSDFKEPSSETKGKGYYTVDEEWKSIEFNTELSDTIVSLMGILEFEQEKTETTEPTK